MATIDRAITNASEKQVRTHRHSVSRFLELLCSVRFGVFLLCLFGLACLLGMLVMQQNVDGFDLYYAELSPTQRSIYNSLGLFDIYRSCYFNALLALLSLNIILASIDRFPRTWDAVTKPNIGVPVRWLRDQPNTIEIESKAGINVIRNNLTEAFRLSGWRKVSVEEKNGSSYHYVESGRWNRFTAYPVHIALLTIFFGGFLTAQMSTSGQMALSPGTRSDLMTEKVVLLDKTDQVVKRLPFEIACNDIEHRLIRKDGPLTTANTIDWTTRFAITDETGTFDAEIGVNRTFDHRGYRFFQSSFSTIGQARRVWIEAVSDYGRSIESIEISHGGSATLADGTVVAMKEFRADFQIGPEDRSIDTSEYRNPAAVLEVSKDDKEPETVYAFHIRGDDIPVGSTPEGGYTFRLKDFEKVSDQHIIAIQRDPGASVVYIGFVMLVITLAAVFLFSHRQIWAVIVPDKDGLSKIMIGGTSNRDQDGLVKEVRSIARDLRL